MELDIGALDYLRQAFFDNQLLSHDRMREKINLILRLYKAWCSYKKTDHGSENKFHNKFFGEIIPIYALSSKLNIFNIMVVGKEEVGIDAVLFMKNGDAFFLECTQAIDGEQRHLQLEHSAKYGSTPRLINIETNKKTKASKTRQVKKTENEFVEGNEIENRLISLLVDTINKKLNKNKPSYKHAWLLVSFYKDYFYGKSGNEGLKNISTTVFSKINNNVFNRIYIMGIEPPSLLEGNHFFDVCMQDTSPQSS